MDAEREAERRQRTAAEAQCRLDALLGVTRPANLDAITQAIRDCVDQLSAGKAQLTSVEAEENAASARVGQLPDAETVVTARNSNTELRSILTEDLAAAWIRATTLAQLSEARTRATPKRRSKSPPQRPRCTMPNMQTGLPPSAPK